MIFFQIVPVDISLLAELVDQYSSNFMLNVNLDIYAQL